MIYPYRCQVCDLSIDVIKSISDATNIELCKCGAVLQRIFTVPMTINPKNFKAEYYHSLGKVITNERQLKNELAKNDLVAIGNDYGSGDKMVDSFEKQREKDNDQKWDKILDKVQL